SRNVFPAYMFLFLSSIVFMLIHRWSSRERFGFNSAVCYLQCASLLFFGILNSTTCAPDPSQSGTIFVVLLLVQPFAMTDVPYRMDILLVTATAVYLVMLFLFKDPKVFSPDATNAVCVCLVGIMLNWIYSAKNMKSLAYRLFIEKQRDSDMLTGLLTKQAARILIDTHLINGRKGIFLIIDLDNFKSVNDTYGHLYGDNVIRKTSDCIRANISHGDIAARFGGDEFTIFYPDMDPDTAKERAGSILSMLSAAFEDEQRQQTCSIGIASSVLFGDFMSLFGDADRALYESKKRGKNMYTYFGDLTDTPEIDTI
ncbi:MAG: GGDEF domain-containing protein, partial [Ruminiclostridium sp.]|nr:GGDEF domain-containing protein [Ruminiclostridium sp.]